MWSVTAMRLALAAATFDLVPLDLARHQGWTPYDRSIDTQVGRLRKKIESNPAKPELIKTVRGVGHALAVPVARLGIAE